MVKIEKLGYGIFKVNGIEYACEEEFFVSNYDKECLLDRNYECCGCGNCLRKWGI